MSYVDNQPRRPELDLGRCFNDAIEVYRQNIVVLVLAAIIFQVASLLSLMILSGPLFGGVCLMLLNALRKPDKHVELGDMFGCMDRFLPLLGMALLTGICELLGLALCLVPGLLLMTIWLYPFFLLVDRRMGVFDALHASKEIVSRKGFGMNFLLMLLQLAIIVGPSVGVYLGIVLGWFLTPLAWLIVASAYVQLVDEDTGELVDVFYGDSI